MRRFPPAFLAAAAALFLVAGCGRKGSDVIVVKPGQTWNVYKGEKKVLVVKNEPGPITSSGMREPGAKPARHPFLSGSALYAPEENTLHDVLTASKDFEDFLKRLQAQGYRLEARE